MQEFVNKTKCTSCSACVNICPQNAINMKENEEGFKYPNIDMDKCINCGLCKKVCPVINTKENSTINKCYVGYAKEENVKMDSSSGGIFPLVAKFILDNSGIVIGASFNSENHLKHIAITSNDELDKLKGSKYLQSDLGDIFKFIKENVNNKKVLFVGTPCQVAGLKSFLKKDYENLICIDLICHGVPSPKLFDKYVKELEIKNGKLIKYIFRDKSTGWDTYSNTMIYRNKKISELSKDNDYMKLFLCHSTLRESCYNCNFKLGNKYSDITLGDYWGVQNYYPDMYSKEGVSAIVINTNKGEEIFNNIKELLKYKECKLEEIVEGNHSLEKSVPRTEKRDEFYKDIDNLSIKELKEKYIIKIPIYKKIIRKGKSFIKRLIKK